MSKYGILGLLNYKEMSGHEIMGAFRDSLNFFSVKEAGKLELKRWHSDDKLAEEHSGDEGMCRKEIETL